MVILHIGMDSIGTTKRNLLNPDELIQLDNTKEIVILRGKKPLMCDKFDYSEHRLASELKMLDDDYIPEWRKGENKNTPHFRFAEQCGVHINI